MTHEKKAITLSVILLVCFSISSVLFSSLDIGKGETWPFPELGPSIIQDSYGSRAPILETIHGILGDIPGGYSLYQGSPIVSPTISNQTGNVELAFQLRPISQVADLGIVVIFLLFSLIPPGVIILIGRSSYGRKKAR